MNRSMSWMMSGCSIAILVLAALAPQRMAAQIDNTTPEWKTQQNRGQMEDATNQAAVKVLKVPKEVKVSVEMDKPRGVMAPWVMAVHALASDAHMTDADVIQLMRAAGITTIRYPGGRIADTYHWSTYRASNFQGLDHPNVGYADGENLGAFLRFMEQVGTTIFTVNYGSNTGTGAGEPSEAAAWVAYVNGNAADTKMIPKDSAGNDWQTVGYWASLRSSAPLPTDDGKNFLRINHPAPFGIRYWEIGNEVFENGYFGGAGLEEDQHAAYPKDPKDNPKQRKKNAALSPEAYGKNFQQFAQAMKSVDPRIKLGVALDKPLAGQISRDEYTQDPVTGKYVQNTSVSVKEDFNRGIDWDKGVLATACSDVDFVALHWVLSDTTQDSGFKDLDAAKVLSAPQDTLRQILMGVVDQLQKNCGQRARGIQVAFTEVGIAPWVKVREEDEVAQGLFAADLYPSLVEYGVVNASWAELHSGLLDQHNKPAPAYFGMQMVHALMNFNDTILTTTSSSSVLGAHASKRADGSIGLMLVNKDGKNATTVKVQINGAGALAAKGIRFDYGKSNPPDGVSIQGKPMEGLGTSLTIPMPPFTATVIVIPKAQ